MDDVLSSSFLRIKLVPEGLDEMRNSKNKN
jgi:hypothetical protein